MRRFFADDEEEQRDVTKAAKARMVELTQEIDNLTQALAQIGVSAALVERLKRSEEERAALQQTLTRTKVNEYRFAEIAQRVRRKITDLKQVLTANASEARQILATVFGHIEVRRESEGFFAAYCDVPVRLIASTAGNVQLKVVAGVGFEPTTFGL